MHPARVALTAAVLIVVATVLGGWHATPVAHANGDPAFTLRNFDYFRTAYVGETEYGEEFINVNNWRVTVCTPRPARLRIRAIVDFRPEARFVRRQPAGCTRHDMRADSDEYPVFVTDSQLRVAWRNHRQRTHWLTDDDPAPD